MEQQRPGAGSTRVTVRGGRGPGTVRAAQMRCFGGDSGDRFCFVRIWPIAWVPQNLVPKLVGVFGRGRLF